MDSSLRTLALPFTLESELVRGDLAVLVVSTTVSIHKILAFFD
jgi:hypothetical protein